MKDGTRLIAEGPSICSWDELKAHLWTLKGLTIFEFVSDIFTDEAWLTFYFQERSFSVHGSDGDYHFFADGTQYPEAVLELVLEHIKKTPGW